MGRFAHQGHVFINLVLDRHPQGIDSLGKQLVDGVFDLIRRIYGYLLQGDTHSGGTVPRASGFGKGNGITGTENDPEGFQVRDGFFKDLQFIFELNPVAAAGDIATRGLPAPGYSRGNGICHRGEDNGNICYLLHGPQGPLGADGEDQVHLFLLPTADELPGFVFITVSPFQIELIGNP